MKKSIFFTRIVIEILLITSSLSVLHFWKVSLSEHSFVKATSMMALMIVLVAYTLVHMSKTVKKFKELSILVGRIILSSILIVVVHSLYQRAFVLIHKDIFVTGGLVLFLCFASFIFTTYFIANTCDWKFKKVQNT